MDPEIEHPDFLYRAPSPTLSPGLEQQNMSRKPVGHNNPLSRPLSNDNGNPQQQQQQQQLPHQNQQAPVANFSSRFPSASYAQDANVTSANMYPPPPNNQYSEGHSRSRSSTHSSPQRPASNAPSAYPGRPASGNVGGAAKQPTSPTMNFQSLYSRPTSSNAGASSSNTRLSKAVASPQPQPIPSSLSHQLPPQSQQSSPPTSQFTAPITGPPPSRRIQILLINPNSTHSMTATCLASIRPKLPPNVELTGYTAPHPAPTAIESTTDAILSSETCIRDLHLHSAANNETIRNFDGFLVACFSAHPLIAALRELYDVPVIGIMEASLYVARMLGGRFGIIATSRRSKILQDDAVAAYGLSHFSIGSEATQLGVLELDSKPKEEVAKRVGHCARRLVEKGADVVILGCAGMSEMMRAAKDAVRDGDGRRLVNVIDGVEAGVWLLSGLAGMGCPTSKKAIYGGSHEVRRARGQEWF